MSDPYLVIDYGQTYIYYICDRNPTASEPLVMTGYPLMLIFWWNQTNNTVWQCMDNTADAMEWNQIVDSASILSVLSSVGWKINTNRSYTQRSSPAFATAYTPSTTNDTFVVASFGLSDSILSPVSLTVAVGGVTIATIGLSGITATETAAFSFIVPANSTYEFTVVSGSPTIVSVYELSQ